MRPENVTKLTDDVGEGPVTGPRPVFGGSEDPTDSPGSLTSRSLTSAEGSNVQDDPVTERGGGICSFYDAPSVGRVAVVTGNLGG